jgi:hypothetical protein
VHVQLFGSSEERSTPEFRTLEPLPLRQQIPTRFATSNCGSQNGNLAKVQQRVELITALQHPELAKTSPRRSQVSTGTTEPVQRTPPFGRKRAQRGSLVNGFPHWWRSVWVAVDGGGGVQVFLIAASSVLLKYQTVERARSGHLRISG